MKYRRVTSSSRQCKRNMLRQLKLMYQMREEPFFKENKKSDDLKCKQEEQKIMANKLLMCK